MLSIILLSVFLLTMVIIGIWGMKKTSTLGDFFLGGRTVGPWVTAFAYGTTYFSAVLFIGFAGKLGWGFGLNALWISAGNTLFGALLAWFVLGRRTRIMTQNLDVMTMPEFLQERFQGKYVKAFAATIIFIFLVPYSASVFKGLGHLFEANFNIPYDMALLIMIGFTGIYLILGGYFAVTLTDFIQGIIMVFGSVILIYVFIDKAGGPGASISMVMERYSQNVPQAKQPDALTIFSLVFMTSFGVWGLPQMVQKFYAIKNESVIPKAAIATTIFSLIIVFTAYFTGAMTHVFYDRDYVQNYNNLQALNTKQGALLKNNMKDDAEKLSVDITKLKNNKLVMEKAQSERIKSGSKEPRRLLLPLDDNGKMDFDRLVPDLLTTFLPDTLMAIILLLILSASMSTLSSLVLVSSSAIAIDLYKGHVNPDISKENSLAMMRFLSGVFIAFSYIVARFKLAIIVTLMSLSWGVVAGSFMAPYFFGLFWRKTTRAGAVAGMVTGMTLAIALFFILGEAQSPLASTIAMIVPFGVVPLVSLFTQPPDKELVERAFEKI